MHIARVHAHMARVHMHIARVQAHIACVHMHIAPVHTHVVCVRDYRRACQQNLTVLGEIPSPSQELVCAYGANHRAFSPKRTTTADYYSPFALNYRPTTDYYSRFASNYRPQQFFGVRSPVFRSR